MQAATLGCFWKRQGGELLILWSPKELLTEMKNISEGWIQLSLVFVWMAATWERVCQEYLVRDGCTLAFDISLLVNNPSLPSASKPLMQLFIYFKRNSRKLLGEHSAGSKKNCSTRTLEVEVYICKNSKNKSQIKLYNVRFGSSVC